MIETLACLEKTSQNMHFGDYWQNQTIEKWPMIWLIIDSIWWTMNIKWRLATLQFAANTFICPLSLGEFVGGPVLMDPFTFSRLYWQKYHSFKALFLLRLRPEVMILPHRDLDHFVRDCFHIMLSQNGDFADHPPPPLLSIIIVIIHTYHHQLHKLKSI